ncbi:metal-nicotianamine transporter YSL3-like isoform X2 [Gossypium australe]|uniref:Metal-nicotianamine transporter YSL3-like isoform X2 n=1 Tax=Gossypium australe TaxID=47621 RepID=A0A5B6VE02_9ROSI|nr:metal-nicotianamine transporter YSL3-like isoform X2 [Gossypium australe]
MVRPNQEAIDTFISITGAPEAVAISMLEEHAGDLNTAVNAYFSEGDRFYFDFSMTYIGAGIICSHLVNLSLLLGAVHSWGVMWPLIGGLKGEWFPATLPALQLYQKAASRMVTRFSFLLL